MLSSLWILVKLWLTMTASSAADPCPAEGIYFTTQQQVDSFRILYPGCTEIAEFVVISGSVKNLDSLFEVEITGTFEISDADSLQNLHGLINLRQVNGNFVIKNADLLKNLYGLDSLKTVNEHFQLSHNASLESLDGLTSLEVYSIDVLDLFFNPLLEHCAVPFICAFLEEDKTYQIWENAPGCANSTQIQRLCDTSLACPNGAVTISSKQQLDEFRLLFPYCTDLQNSLYIEFATDLDSNGLKELSHIKSVEGSIMLYANSSLQSLEGLDSLRHIGGNLLIQYNEELTDLSALAGLTAVSGVFIAQNTKLEDIRVLDVLSPDSVSYLYIRDNPKLNTCNTDFICQYIQSKKQFDIKDNDTNCVSAFAVLRQCNPGLECPPADLILNDQYQINQFGIYFPNCTEINGKLEIWDEELDILDLSPLKRIRKIKDEFKIFHLVAKTDLSGLDSLTETGGLTIEVNPGLKSLHGLENLKSVNGDIYIRDNSVLTDISAIGFVNPHTIKQFFITENPFLKWCGLNTICEYILLGRSLIVSQNDSSCASIAEVQNTCGIVHCSGTSITLTSQAEVDHFPVTYPACNTVSQLIISGADITNLDSLYPIRVIRGDLTITTNSALTSVAGLHQLQQIGGYLWVESNPQLQSLSGWTKFTSLSGGLYIYNNASLSAIDALQKVQSGTIYDLVISTNPKLAVCNVPLICNFLNDSNSVYFISDNATGCNTKAQVSTACGNATCPVGSVTLTSQQEVNEYKKRYLDCTLIPGDLTITGEDIHYLDSLHELISIHGRLIIENTSLATLHGLENINHQLLQRLILRSNDSLSVCELKPVCDYLSGPLAIYEINGNAPACASWEAIQYECSKFCFYEGLVLSNQTEVNQFPQNYPNCSTIPGSLTIQTADITNLDSLYNLRKIGGFLLIENTRLDNLKGLDQLNKLGSSLIIRNNSILADLKSLSGLDTIGGSLTIQNNGSLPGLTGLEQIHFIPFSCTVRDNAKLVSLQGLQNLSMIANSLTILNNSLLKDLEGIHQLKQIGLNLTIQSNAGLKNLAGLDRLDSIGNNLRIQSNAKLDSLWPVPALRYVGRDLIIQSNVTLKNLNGFAALTVVRRTLNINNNPLLTDITGLAGVNPAAVTSLIIQNNRTLNLCSIQNICQYLNLPQKNSTISGNDTSCISKAVILANCAVKALSIQYFTLSVKQSKSGNELSWAHTQEIEMREYIPEHSKNGLDFISLKIFHPLTISSDGKIHFIHAAEEGLHYYRIRIIHHDTKSAYSNTVKINMKQIKPILFPNPGSGLFTISAPATTTVKKITVTDQLGRIVWSQHMPTSLAIDLRGQPNGIYYFTLNAGDDRWNYKVLKADH